jgi:hypothetical protein
MIKMKEDMWGIILFIVGSISVYLVLSGQMDGTGFIGIFFIIWGLYRILISN